MPAKLPPNLYIHQLAGREASSATHRPPGESKGGRPGVTIVYVRDYAVAFALLKDGSIDAFPTDESVLHAISNRTAIPTTIFSFPILRSRATSVSL